MDSIERQKKAVKPGAVVQLTGSIWKDQLGLVETVRVDRGGVWVVARLANGIKVVTNGFREVEVS